MFIIISNSHQKFIFQNCIKKSCKSLGRILRRCLWSLLCTKSALWNQSILRAIRIQPVLCTRCIWCLWWIWKLWCLWLCTSLFIGIRHFIRTSLFTSLCSLHCNTCLCSRCLHCNTSLWPRCFYCCSCYIENRTNSIGCASNTQDLPL